MKLTLVANLEYDTLLFTSFSRNALRGDPQPETQAQPRPVTSDRAGRVWYFIEKRHYYPLVLLGVFGFSCRLWQISFQDDEWLLEEDGDSQRNDMSTSVIVPSQLLRLSTGSITPSKRQYTSG
jgi:hypothetical protein